MADPAKGATETPVAPAPPAPPAAPPPAAPPAPPAAAPEPPKPAAAAPGEKPAETPAPAGAPSETPKPPEKYTLTIPPDQPHLSASNLAEIEAIAKASGWSNEDAQNAINEYVTRYTLQASRFLEETKADPEYGGDKLAESQRLANSIVNRVRPAGHARRDGFLRVLHSGGNGNNIEVLSFLADLGRLMGEDSPSFGRSRSAAPNDASKLYDHATSRALDEASKKAG